jgi:phospholipid/cholesterol/gamma-HCH transport system substrate-binding protein
MKKIYPLSKELKIGVFSILILASLFFLINYLKGKDLFGKTNLYYAIYDNVEGLTTTGPVYIKGLRVGFVEKIDYEQEKDKFIVTLSVKSGYKIPENSVAEIFSSDILGTKSIRIELGQSKMYLEEKDTLGTNVSPSLITVLTNELVPLKEKAENLIESMNNTFSNINDVLDAKTKRDITETLAKLNTTVGNLASVTGTLKAESPKITTIVGNVEDITSSLKSDSKILKRGLENIVTVTDSLKASDIAGTINSLKNILGNIDKQEGTLGKLIKTDSLHTQINNLLLELENLVKNINENPKKYIKVSVF